MKYIKAKVQELSKVNYVFAAVNYIDYNKTLKAAAIYTINDVDTIYMPIEERFFESFLDNFVSKDVVTIDKMCFVQPFEELLENASKKNREDYILKHEEIKQKVALANSKKK